MDCSYRLHCITFSLHHDLYTLQLVGPWEWEPTRKIIHPAMSDHLTKFSGSRYNGWGEEIVGIKNMGLCGMGNLVVVISLVSPVTVLKLVQHHTWSLYCILSVFNQKMLPICQTWADGCSKSHCFITGLIQTYSQNVILQTDKHNVTLYSVTEVYLT